MFIQHWLQFWKFNFQLPGRIQLFSIQIWWVLFISSWNFLTPDPENILPDQLQLLTHPLLQFQISHHILFKNWALANMIGCFCKSWKYMKILVPDMYIANPMSEFNSDGTGCCTNIVSTLLLLGICSLNALLAHYIAVNTSHRSFGYYKPWHTSPHCIRLGYLEKVRKAHFLLLLISRISSHSIVPIWVFS
jgi:hypothetical protein